MRLMLAGMLGAIVGLLQLVVIAGIESQSAGPSGLDTGDTAYVIIAALIVLEILGVLALSMYRMGPWVLRLLRADWEEHLVLKARAENSGWLSRGVVVATVLRRIVVMVDHRVWSFDLLLSLVVALAALLLPLPKVKLRATADRSANQG